MPVFGVMLTVRLLNIDTPERSELFYHEASSALAQLIGGEDIYLAFEAAGQPTLGKYGRLLAYLYDPEGRNLNLEMVRLGWTPFYTKYGTGRLAVSFAEAHLDAYVSRRGIWQMRGGAASVE